MSYTFTDFLHLEVSPALGCTEPVAVALAASAAAHLVPQEPVHHLQVWVDGNVFKNGLAVIIPGTKGLKGLDLAAALGALGGDPGQGMQVLEGISAMSLQQAVDLVRSGKVRADLDPRAQGLSIRARVESASQSAEAWIQGAHDAIVGLWRNEKAITDHPLLTDRSKAGGHDVLHLEQWLQKQSLDTLLHMLDQIDEQDLARLRQGVDMNHQLALYGLTHAPGLGVGRALSDLADEQVLCRDMLLEAKIMTAAAADARMAGINLPAMSSAGSGNNGLTAILPIWAVREYVQCSESTLLQGIGLSHLITAFIKTHTGRLSAVCSCSLAAGAGSAAGLAFILSRDPGVIAQAVNNVIEDLGGVLCDGAKTGCALKLATAAGSAIQAALLATRQVTAPVQDGILGQTLDQSVANLGRLCRQGMADTGSSILNIMLDKTRSQS